MNVQFAEQVVIISRRLKNIGLLRCATETDFDDRLSLLIGKV